MSLYFVLGPLAPQHKVALLGSRSCLAALGGLAALMAEAASFRCCNCPRAVLLQAWVEASSYRPTTIRTDNSNLQTHILRMTCGYETGFET